MTRLESGGSRKLGDAPGALKNGGVFRQIEGALWRGEAASDGGSPGRSRAGPEGLGVRLGAWGDGAAKEGAENKVRCPGEQAPSRPEVRTSAPLPSRSPFCSGSRRNVLQMLLASLPAEGSAGSCASERKVSSWPEPISQMGEGRFSLHFRSFSQPKLLGLFPSKT